jgi:hypothetical protein
MPTLGRSPPAPALPGPRLDHEYRALHGDVAGALQKYLALTSPVRGLASWYGLPNGCQFRDRADFAVPRNGATFSIHVEPGRK